MTTPNDNNRPVIEGDPFGQIKTEYNRPEPPPRDVNSFHARSDLDSGQFAQHHTIGIGHNQAAAGDHTHDGSNSRLIGQNQGLSINNTAGFTDAQRIQSIITLLHKFVDFKEN